MILASPPPFLIHKCRQMPRPPGPLRQSRVPLRAQTVESLGRLLGGEKLYYRREYDAKHNERLPQHPSQPLLGSKLFRRVRISRSVHLLRLVMAWLCAKGPLKDIRTRAAKAKNVCGVDVTGFDRVDVTF